MHIIKILFKQKRNCKIVQRNYKMTFSEGLVIILMIFVFQYITKTIFLKTDILSHNTWQHN